MKNLTSLLLIIIATLLCSKSNAQSFGIRGGLNLANMLEKDDEETYSDDFNMNPGFHLGISVDVPLNDVLSLEPGLLFTTRGLKIKEEFTDGEVIIKLNLQYLSLPLTLKASHDLGGGSKIFGAFGPYGSVALSGKLKTTVEFEGEKVTDEEDLDLGNDEDNDVLRRPDIGLTMGGGVEINSVLVGVWYDYGLSNTSSYQGEGTTTKNRVLQVSVGYRF